MDLALKPEHKAFADEVRDFARANLSPATSEKTFSGKHYDRDDHMAWQQALGRQGWLAYTWPKKYGGPGWTSTQRYLFENVLAEEGAPRIIPFGVNMVGAGDLHLRHATSRSSASCPASARRRCGGARAIPSPAPAPTSPACRPRRACDDGDHYIVNGQKTWTTLAQYADWGFFLVRTDPDAKPQDGISFLLIDMKTPGITVRPIITLDGGHEVNDVFLDNVKVPVENRIGEENQGWTCAKFLLAHERSGIAGVPASKRGVRSLRDIARSEPADGGTLAARSGFHRADRRPRPAVRRWR